jgi:glucokinase
MAVFAGFDLGGTGLKCGVVDENGKILHKAQAPTPATAEGFFSLVESLWAGLQKQVGEPIRAAGFGLPGIFDLAGRRILESPHTGGLDGVEIEPALERLLGVPVRADNDANMAAYGEWRHGAGRGVANLILLTVGTGIGAGIIADGRLLRGGRGYAGEAGHMPVRPDGEACACGGRGCLETEASARSIVRRYREATGSGEPITAEEIQARAAAGDASARAAVAESARFLGIGLGILINLFNPEKILLGGGVLGAGDDVLRPAVEEAARRSFKNAYQACRIERAALANEAGIIGAAARAAEPAAGIIPSRGNE